jgi:PAS domain S-box-containing protein
MEHDAKILILDDDAQILRAQVELLEKAGYEVAEAATGEKGLRLARDMEPDLILVDVGLADIDGLEVCQRIKADPALSRTLVVLLSDVAIGPDEQAAGLEASADGVIVRPIPGRELLTGVEALLHIRRVDEKLRESEARYRDVFENAPVGIYRTAPSGEILMANPALVHMLGYDSFEELAQRDLESEGYHPDYPRSEFRRRPQEEGHVTGLESAWRRKDGSTLFVRESARAVYDARGQVVAYQGTVEDVTAREEAQAALRQSEAKMRSIFRAAPVGIGVVSDRVLLEVNDRLCEITGYSRDELIGENARLLYPTDEDYAYVGTEKYRQIAERGTGTVETQLERKSGEIIDVLLSSTPFDPNDLSAGVTFTVLDITERKRVQEKLRESEERLRLIVEGTEALLVNVSTRGRITYANEALARRLGQRSEDMIGRFYLRFIHPEDRARVSRAYFEQAEGGTSSTSLEFRLATAAGDTCWVNFVAHPITQKGQVVEVAGLALDITERKRALEALRESEEEYRRLVETLNEGIWRIDAEGYTTFVNPRMEEMLGYSAGEMEGEHLFAFMDDEWVEEARHRLKQRQQGVTEQHEFTFRKKSGEPVHMLLSTCPVFDDHGTYAGALAGVVDITERRKAQEALRESEERYRTLVEQSQDGIYLLYDHRFEFINSRFEDLFGVTQEAVRASDFDFISLVAPESRPLILERERKLAAGEQVSPRYEFTALDVDGNRIYVEVSVSYLPYRDGLATRGMVHDITERKQAEEALKESEEKYRGLFESSSDGILLHDLEGAIVDANQKALDLLAYTRGEMAALNVSDLHPPEAMGKLRWASERLTAQGSVGFEIDFMNRSGGTFPAEVSSSLFEIDGTPAVQSVVRDITERKEMQEQLRRQERLAAVGQLAGGIAHDFNNILAAIILCAQMPLRGRGPSPRTQHALETIIQESRRGADLVQQILDFSRSAMMETEALSLVAVVREMLTLLRRTIPAHVRLATEMTSHPCIVQADRTRIQQVLMNLALNAKDAMREGGELRIEVERVAVAPEDEPPLPDMARGAWACLTVSDSGTGMTEEVRDHLFEPFFTTKEEGQGTGLGLAQVYGIVRQHQGFIDVATAVGEGTTFTIYLPLVEDRDVQVTADTEATPMQGRGETVLVVEDAERLRRAITAGLESSGYRVITAANGREALETVSRHAVDLVLTDVVMPEMGGGALLQSLRTDDPHLKVIAMTGHVVETDVKGLQAAGFADALPKPFSLEELTQLVREVLDRRGS